MISTTLMLSAVLWNVGREMSHDHWIFGAMSDPGIRAAVGDDFQPGYGACRVLKTFTEESKSVIPFGINVVNTSGNMLIVGISPYMIAICAKVLASVDELWISVPCVTLVLGMILFGVICTLRMGVELS